MSSEPRIWVDADASPGAVKQILFRAADKRGIRLTLVANHAIRVPPSRFIEFRQVLGGFDVADNEIVQAIEPGDLVVTSDIPLAAEVIEKGATVVNFRGEALTRENVGAKLNMRDFMDTMRASGVQSGGPAALSKADVMRFANALDRWAARRNR